MPDPLCPDCGNPVSTHAMYRTGLCPVVRFPRMPDPLATLLGTQELAAMLGIKPRTVSAYLVRGGRSVPAPCARLACGPVWKLQDVQEWQKKRLDTRAAVGSGGS